MYYYLSILLAVGITTLNSPNKDLSFDFQDYKTAAEPQIVTQVTSAVDLASESDVSANTQSESSVESETRDLNTDLLPIAIAGTAVFTVFLLSLLFKKEDIIIDGEVLQLDAQEDETLETEAILAKPYLAPHTSLSELDLVPRLIVELQTSDRNIRHKTIGELAQKGDSRAMKPLVELMIEADSQERNLILEAMTQITSLTLQPMNQVSIFSLDIQNSQDKQNAIRDLTRVYQLMSQVTTKLSQIINDSEQQIQKTATWALKQLKEMPETPTWQLTNLISNGKMITDN